MKCHRCKQDKEKSELIGANVFDATTGTHIITHWYCHFCANAIGLLTGRLSQ